MTMLFIFCIGLQTLAYFFPGMDYALSADMKRPVWKTFERSADCQGEVVWRTLRVISSDGALREASWRSPCPVMQVGRIQFNCSTGQFRKQLPGWKLGPWKQPGMGTQEQQDLQASCRRDD